MGQCLDLPDYVYARQAYLLHHLQNRRKENFHHPDRNSSRNPREPHPLLQNAVATAIIPENAGEVEEQGALL